MPKFNYFDSLESICTLSSRAVFLACSQSKSSPANELSSIRHTADRKIYELERVLFSDFMPPLERSELSAFAHSLNRVIECCTEAAVCRNIKSPLGERRNKEAELCIRLSQLIEENAAILRRVRHPSEIPDIISFRKLLCEARNAHISMQKKLSSGLYPRSAQYSLCVTGRLRCELARAFDDLIEVMLSNI